MSKVKCNKHARQLIREKTQKATRGKLPVVTHTKVGGSDHIPLHECAIDFEHIPEFHAYRRGDKKLLFTSTAGTHADAAESAAMLALDFFWPLWRVESDMPYLAPTNESSANQQHMHCDSSASDVNNTTGDSDSPVELLSATFTRDKRGQLWAHAKEQQQQQHDTAANGLETPPPVCRRGDNGKTPDYTDTIHSQWKPFAVAPSPLLYPPCFAAHLNRVSSDKLTFPFDSIATEALYNSALLEQCKATVKLEVITRAYSSVHMYTTVYVPSVVADKIVDYCNSLGLWAQKFDLPPGIRGAALRNVPVDATVHAPWIQAATGPLMAGTNAIHLRWDNSAITEVIACVHI